jgi:hypothetical protein
LVVYHGTHKDFSVFKTPAYFSSGAEYSKWFGNVISCFLLIKKPFFSLIPTTELKHAFSNYCKNNGFDGGINKYETPNIFFVISPNQIKLADGTNTEFDLGNDDIRFEQGGEIYFNSTKSISIKIKKDLYVVQYRRGERGDTEKNVWFAKVISKNGEEVEGRLCLAPNMFAVVYGFSLKEVESLIWEAYIDNELYLIIEDDYGNEKEIVHILVSNEYKRFDVGGEIKYITPEYLKMFLGK